MSSTSWILEEKTLPKLGFLGQGNYGYISLVRTPDALLMDKKTSLHKYSENLEKESRILNHFNSIDFRIVRPTSPMVYYETKPVNVKVCSIYMELAPHGSLHDVTAKAGGILSENVAGYCIFQVLEGLRDLHRDGYVHCDLMATNVLVFPSYTHGELCELKLAGFSLAKEPNGPNPVEPLFNANRQYLAPEVARGMISSTIDIWSLGVMVAEMLGATVTEEGIITHFKKRLSWFVREFLGRCLHHNPTARATVEELMNHRFVKQSLEVPPVEMLPVPSCLSNGVVQGRYF